MSDELLGYVDDAPLAVTSFYGGRERGLCLQFTPIAEPDYAQLTHAQVVRLVTVCQAWLAEFPPEPAK